MPTSITVCLANFNPRSPHGERPPPKHGGTRIPGISTHAPRTGSDIGGTIRSNLMFTFQPTLPARGATFAPSDTVTATVFQPTLPARGATAEVVTA